MAKIAYKQDNIELIMSKLNKVSGVLSGITTVGGSMAGDSLFEGFNKIQKNMGVIGNRAMGCASVLGKGNDSFAQSEVYLESVIDSIELPTDLKNVYSPTEQTVVDTSLSKEDGKSVNDTDNTKEEQLEDINVRDKALGDITKAEVKDEQLTDMYADQGKVLGNVNKDGGDTLQEAEDVKLTQEIALGETKQGDTEEQVMKDNYASEGRSLGDVTSTGGTEEKEYKDTLKDAKGSTLEEVNTDEVKTSEYKDGLGESTGTGLNDVLGSTAAALNAGMNQNVTGQNNNVPTIDPSGNTQNNVVESNPESEEEKKEAEGVPTISHGAATINASQADAKGNGQTVPNVDYFANGGSRTNTFAVDNILSQPNGTNN